MQLTKIPFFIVFMIKPIGSPFFLIGNISTFNFEIEQFIIYHQIFACTLRTQIKIKKNKSEILLIYFMISIHIYITYISMPYAYVFPKTIAPEETDE